MLHNFEVPLEWKRLSALLEAADVRNEIQQISFNPNKLAFEPYIADVLSDLEAKNKVLPYNITFQLIYLYEDNKYLILEPFYHFNKYRLICLRSDFYQAYPANFDLLKFKNYCKTRNEEAIKSGLRANIWHNEIGANIFGAAEDAGYFGGNGSSGWKYLALCNFLFDLYSQSKNMKLYRIAPYENIMVDGKLFTINNLFGRSEEHYKTALKQYFIRNIKLVVS
ncbi:MAG: hypothetical protein ACI9C9_000101 [Marivirga sp.]|jgi:hypothetical protein